MDVFRSTISKSFAPDKTGQFLIFIVISDGYGGWRSLTPLLVLDEFFVGINLGCYKFSSYSEAKMLRKLNIRS